MAMPLPKAARSGVTPNRVWASPRWKRKPVMVHIEDEQGAVLVAQRWRRPGRKSGAGQATFMGSRPGGKLAGMGFSWALREARSL